ncbi:hypothetical protein BGZ80_005971 [Entomortierella chlamydospora]|uniref:Uncharacterized protein n=1 Tax=Entomortierella chlamydospora TaxID=101097 RepID=A0A9P6MIW8_9FUNG|nr:hypothetical protein BGZ80_005971 [Entomortierella chlamydospora]
MAQESSVMESEKIFDSLHSKKRQGNWPADKSAVSTSSQQVDKGGPTTPTRLERVGDEGQNVFDNEDSGEDLTNREVIDDEEEDESMEDLAYEVVELIEKSEPGFHPLIRAF